MLHRLGYQPIMCPKCGKISMVKEDRFYTEKNYECNHCGYHSDKEQEWEDD